MGIGLGVFLIIVGAVLSFTTLDTQYIGSNLDTVGFIIIAGGFLALIFGTIQNYQRTHTRHEEVVDRRSRSVNDTVVDSGERRVVDERRAEDL
ncbi:hypothetical protein V3N99_12210 [Dermatophilaceae bacterium Soc4.6]